MANISLIEWNRNLDKVKGDRNSNPYGVLALADRQIVTDAGANAVLQVVGSKVSLLAVLPKNGQSASRSRPRSLRAPTAYLYVGELAEGAGKGKARVWRIPPRAAARRRCTPRASRRSPAWRSDRTAACS